MEANSHWPTPEPRSLTVSLTRSELDAMIQEGLDSADRGDLFTEDDAHACIAATRAKL